MSLAGWPSRSAWWWMPRSWWWRTSRRHLAERRQDGGAAGDRGRGHGRGGAAGHLLGADHRAGASCRSSRCRDRRQDVPSAGAHHVVRAAGVDRGGADDRTGALGVVLGAAARAGVPVRPAFPRRLPAPPRTGHGPAEDDPAASRWWFWSSRAGLLPYLGTEFIPTLDEGAIAINVGAAAQRLAGRFGGGGTGGRTAGAGALPGGATVVTKTGRAEISEDPMGPEQSDFFIMLKPRKGEWGTGRNKARTRGGAERRDLRHSRPAALVLAADCAARERADLGGKSDLAVKIFGPDLES